MAKREFQPSKQSVDAGERTAATLRYLKKAADAVQQHLDNGNDLPHWVNNNINHAAAQMGMAVSYTAHCAERKFQAAEKEERKKRRRKKT